MANQSMVTEKTKLEFSSIGQALGEAGQGVIRYGLALVLVWVGALKFTAYEAEGIQPLVENSPLMAWTLSFMSIYDFSKIIGVVEIAFGILIAMRCVLPFACAVGSLGAVVMFLTTLTFVFTTPGVWQEGYGFPFASPMPGQFLLKDVVFLGAALWSAGEALHACADEPRKALRGRDERDNR